jgi:hypothetical protein
MMNGTDDVTAEMLEGLFNGTDIFAGLFNGSFPDIMNGTDAMTAEMLEGLFGGNGTDFLGLFNSTDFGFPDFMGGDSNYTDFMGMGGMDQGFGDMSFLTCPDACDAEVCEVFSPENTVGPDMDVLSDACDAGIIKECSYAVSVVCVPVCGGNSDLPLDMLGLNESMVDDICSLCSFLDCCDGVNTFETCKSILPDEAFADAIVEDTDEAESQTDSAAEEASSDVLPEGSDIEESSSEESNTGSNEVDASSEGSGSGEVVDAATETEDGSPAYALFFSRSFSVVCIVLLVNVLY